MKKRMMLLLMAGLALTAVLTACGAATPIEGEPQAQATEVETKAPETQQTTIPAFAFTVEEAADALKRSAESLDKNIFETAPEILTTEDGPTYVYSMAEGVDLILYGDPAGKLTSVYLVADKTVWDDNGADLMGRYSWLLLVNFTANDTELSGVDAELDLANTSGESSYMRFASCSVADFIASMDSEQVYLLITPA